MRSSQKIALLAFAVAAAAPRAHGQDAQCNIDESKPGAVKDARNNLVKGGLLGKAEDKTKMLTEAVRTLTTSNDQSNPLGRAWVLGRAYAMIAAQLGTATTVPRGNVGITTNASTTIDLLAATDSAFRTVESAMPQCASETEPFRRQLYAPLITKAVNFYNAHQNDSAAFYAQRSLVIYPKSPIAYNVLGNLAQQKEDYAAALAAFRRMVASIGDDTSYAEDKKSAMYTVAQLSEARLEKAAGADKTTLLKDAREAYQAYQQAYPNDPRGATGLARIAGLAGDTAAVARQYGEMVSNPAKYTDIQLFEAGVGAARANNAPVAAKLFETGLQKNPSFRDALFNLAATYSTLDRFDDMLPILQRLVAVDPNNPDNYQLYALAYQAKVKAAKDAAAKSAPKTSGRGGRAGSQQGTRDTPQIRAMNDSLLKYFKLYQEMPVKVLFTLFSHDGPKVTLGGTIENRSSTEASYDLKVDFLDASGNVVASQSTTVAAVPPKGSKPFTMNVEKEGIVAYRYAPVVK